jgi:hypothetical protein
MVTVMTLRKKEERNTKAQSHEVFEFFRFFGENWKIGKNFYFFSLFLFEPDACELLWVCGPARVA